MNAQGEIYSAPADQIPIADVKRLEEFINRTFAKLPEPDGKMPASAISAYVREFQKPRTGQQLKFDFVDGGIF